MVLLGIMAAYENYKKNVLPRNPLLSMKICYGLGVLIGSIGNLIYEIFVSIIFTALITGLGMFIFAGSICTLSQFLIMTGIILFIVEVCFFFNEEDEDGSR